MRAAILTISDSRTQGARADTATPRLRRALEAARFTVEACALVPDETASIAAQLRAWCDEAGVPLIVTTGGTGFGPRDVTPEATRQVLEREAPGLAECMRHTTARRTRAAWLSRGVAGVRGRSLIINLPGSPAGAVACLRAVLPLLPHALATMQGHAHDRAAAR